jgi:hypothetical protein
MKIKTVTAKLATMRKPQEFVIYPPDFSKPDQPIFVTVQSDKAIGRFDPTTGKGVLNYRGSNSKYFMHLVKFMGAEDFQFPVEFVKEVMDAIPSKGDEIGAGAFIG